MTAPAKRLAVPTILACILALGIVVAGCLYAYWKCKEGQKRSSAISAAASLAAALVTEIQTENAPLLRRLNLQEGEDKRLSDSEYDELIAALSNRHPLDLPKNWHDTGMLVDPWGNRYEIVLKWLGPGQWNPVVRSYGPDGIPLTKDDLVR